VSQHLTNWAGNHAYAAADLRSPRTIDEMRQVVARSSKLKALGTRHSFNDIADTSGELVSLEHFDRIDEPDHARRAVTLGAGVRYGELCRHLDDRGFALHNLASLPHISVAGAVATATHGSGVSNGNLATAIAAMQIVTADGDVQEVSRQNDRDAFDAIVVGLGAPGIVTRLTLDVVPSFQVRQDVYQHLPLSALGRHFDQIMSGGYSVSVFTDWRSDRVNQVWVKRRDSDRTTIDLTDLGATRAAKDLHPIAHLSAENCTRQLGVPGPWHQRLPHFRLEFTPSAGEELQSEYFVARERAVEALRAIDAIRDRVAEHLQISEVRTIAADTLWMSPCYRRDSVTIHFTWKKDWPAVRAVLPLVESQLAPFDARPHWGKLFAIPPPRLRSLYPKLLEFRRLVEQFDPAGKFRNRFLATHLFE
jgi:xylitol oxidase